MNPLCIQEAKWVSQAIAANVSSKKYLMVASACLESDNIDAVLDDIVSCERVVGIRQILNHNPSWPRNDALGDLLLDAQWRSGFAKLQSKQLIFDLQINPCQFHTAASFLSQYPDQVVVLNHLGCLQEADIGNEEVTWQGLTELARLPNIFVKLSMLCYTHSEWDVDGHGVKEAVHRVISIFGIDRCFFASNFPVDIKDQWPADRLLPSFISLGKRYGVEGMHKLFHINAQTCYGRNLP